jgi:sialate O-acetylesterase
MECAVRNTINADSEVQHSANDTIRHVTISRDVTRQRRHADFRNRGMESGEAVDHAGFLGSLLLLRARAAEDHVRCRRADHLVLGRHAHRDLAVRAGAAPAGGNDAKLDLLAEYGPQPGSAAASLGGQWQKWWSSRRQPQGLQPWAVGRAPTANGSPRRPSSHSGKTGTCPELAEYDGMMWYRAQREAHARAGEAGRVVSLGVIDDVDLVWVNGQPMAAARAKTTRVPQCRRKC